MDDENLSFLAQLRRKWYEHRLSSARRKYDRIFDKYDCGRNLAERIDPNLYSIRMDIEGLEIVLGLSPPVEIEMVSVCCAAPEDPDIEGFCSACREGTGFERADE